MKHILVTSAEEARTNIERYATELVTVPGLARILGTHPAWYAVRGKRGKWLVAPSKFVGYRDNTARDYLRTNRAGHSGGPTENILKRWFSPVRAGTPLHSELEEVVRQLLAEFGKLPNKRLRISVLTDELNEARGASHDASELVRRVTVKPDVCGGRPCIRGMRIRVSDILDLFAAGEDRAQILSEYPYLEGEDIDAALAYAARSLDHRIIEVA